MFITVEYGNGRAVYECASYRFQQDVDQPKLYIFNEAGDLLQSFHVVADTVYAINGISRAVDALHPMVKFETYEDAQIVSLHYARS